MKKKDSKMDSIIKLASELKEIQMQAEALGVFLNDRELIECPGCGLLEDVEISGKLITYFKGETLANQSSTKSTKTGMRVPSDLLKINSFSEEKMEDIGLRFREENLHVFQCPNCHNIIDLSKKSD